MTSCCDGPAPSRPVAEAAACPRCGTSGTSVAPITLKALLTTTALRRGVPTSPRFCATEGCAVVYFDSAAAIFTEQDVTVRTYAKHPSDGDVLICHCFGYDLASVAAAPQGTIRQAITREVQAGHCACEVRNPRGVCCLGDVVSSERRLRETPPEKG